MSIVEDLVKKLHVKYDFNLPFKQICKDENIIVAKSNLEDGINGFYLSSKNRRIIILNSNITYQERRDWAWHELWHHFYSGGKAEYSSHNASNKEEKLANLFAALCRAPKVRDGETIESLAERYNISSWLAKIRIEYEIKKFNS